MNNLKNLMITSKNFRKELNNFKNRNQKLRKDNKN